MPASIQRKATAILPHLSDFGQPARARFIQFCDAAAFSVTQIVCPAFPICPVGLFVLIRHGGSSICPERCVAVVGR